LPTRTFARITSLAVVECDVVLFLLVKRGGLFAGEATSMTAKRLKWMGVAAVRSTASDLRRFALKQSVGLGSGSMSIAKS